MLYYVTYKAVRITFEVDQQLPKQVSEMHEGCFYRKLFFLIKLLIRAPAIANYPI